MTAGLTENELTEWFPISFQEIDDPWAAPEPSKGALVKLDAGEYIVLDYGKDSSQLTIRIPSGIDASECLASLFREVPLPRRACSGGAQMRGCRGMSRRTQSSHRRKSNFYAVSFSQSLSGASSANASPRRSRRRPGPACG